MNSKKTFKAVGVAALALATVSWNEAAQASSVTLNGQPLATSVAPIIRTGRTLVPMRDIFEALGATVQWNSLTRGIIATRGTTTIGMQIGRPRAQVNNQRVRLEQAPIIYRGSTMVPLRFVSESLGANVQWDGIRQIAAITTDGTTNTGTQVADARSITVPSGAVVPVTLDSRLSSATAQVGQTFTSTVISTEPGDSEFPSGSKIEGVITEVRRKTSSNPGMLDVDFRAVVLPTGERYPMQGRLSALDSDSVTHESQGRIVAKSTASNSKDRVKIIGIGAGAGFLIGKVLLKQNGILSAVLGAAGGYLYSQSQSKNRLTEVSLDPGTKLGVRLDRPVTYSDANGYYEQRAPYIR